MENRFDTAVVGLLKALAVVVVLALAIAVPAQLTLASSGYSVAL